MISGIENQMIGKDDSAYVPLIAGNVYCVNSTLHAVFCHFSLTGPVMATLWPERMG